MTQPPEERPNSGSGLTAKVGPLPTWAWIGLAATGGVIVLLWLRARRNAATTNPAPNVVGPDAATVSNLQDQLATVNSQIRDLQGNQSTPQPTGPTVPTPSNPFPNPGTSPSGPHTTGPLRPGTTLGDLAKLYWGDPSLASLLYYSNTAVIEDAAHKAGYPSSNGGTILVPGINLEVPPKPSMNGAR